MRALLGWGTVLLLAASLPCRAEGFAFEVASPKFKVTIPGIPQMKMDVHPKNASQPQFRFLGTAHPYAVAIFTPAAVGGTDCVEVHATRVSIDEDDLASWITDLRKAGIEPD